MGALIGGGITVAASLITQRREASRHENRWMRNTLMKIYENAMKSLLLLSMSSLKRENKEHEVQSQFAEAQAYLILMKVFNPDETIDIEDISKNMSELWDKNEPLAEIADKAIEKVKECLSKDIRLKIK